MIFILNEDHKDVVVVMNRHQRIVGSSPTRHARNMCRHGISFRAEDIRASRKGPLDGARDPPSFSVGMVDPTHSSRDMPVNLNL